YNFARHVKIGQVHKFTVIQIACLVVVLWVVKAIKAISILFPIMVLAMCFIRKALDFVFDQSELKWIDDIMPPITVSLGRKRNSGDEGGAASGAPGAASSGRQPITIELDIDLKQPAAATQHFNVSNEVDRTSILKNLTGAGGNADGGKSSKKQKKNSKKASSSSAAGGNEDVGGAGKLDDADKEAAEALLKMPEIVVEPPSGCSRGRLGSLGGVQAPQSVGQPGDVLVGGAQGLDLGQAGLVLAHAGQGLPQRLQGRRSGRASGCARDRSPSSCGGASASAAAAAAAALVG
uniref:HCO3_cotransp domain-containing protein n=1 Tax=Macrostomum lignano TaxID=282301 RepID=A0A1I8IYZ4_9PLAT